MPSLIEWLNIDKVIRFVRIVRFNGGIIGSMKSLYRIDELKYGTLVGVDKFGNQYYENNEYFHCRNRWVKYSDSVHLDYNASQIPAEWHRWIHYTTDVPPTVEPPVKHRWLSDHSENMTGTHLQYVPYSTTPPKIESWVPQDPNKK